MKTNSYRKVGMRYAILMVLGMTLAIVAKPNKASAVQSACVTACGEAARACLNDCRESGEIGCEFDCTDQEVDCTNACNGD